MAGSTEYRTPAEEFMRQHARLAFNVDAAATPENALVGGSCKAKGFIHRFGAPGQACGLCGGILGRFYTAETDGTKREHYGPGDVVWANPPYNPASLLYRFVETAWLTSREQGATWQMLLPPAVETRWFQNFIYDHELNRARDRVDYWFPPKRIRFIRPDGKPSSPRSGNLYVIFRPPLEAK